LDNASRFWFGGFVCKMAEKPVLERLGLSHVDQLTVTVNHSVHTRRGGAVPADHSTGGTAIPRHIDVPQTWLFFRYQPERAEGVEKLIVGKSQQQNSFRGSGCAIRTSVRLSRLAFFVRLR
jgi:hypothetical protein